MAYRRIVQFQYVDTFETKKASGAISPGHVVEFYPGDTEKVRAHSTTGGDVAPLMVAEINFGEGQTVSDDFADGDQLDIATLRPGDKFAGRIANGQNIADGDYLMSDGYGKLTKYVAQTFGEDSSSQKLMLTSYPRRIVAIAREAKDMSDSSAADPDQLCLCEAV